MSRLPFWQSISADAPASENSIDGSTLNDGIRESGDSYAYDRLQPGIERDSPLFLAKVAEFEALLYYPGQTLLNVIKTAGFTPIEQQLLISRPSPRVDLDLYGLQNKNRQRYRFRLLLRGVRQDEPPVIQLALCWFGAPFSSLVLDASGNITTFGNPKFTKSVSRHAHRADEDDGDSLAFLDKYDAYRPPSPATAEADDVGQYLNHFQGPSRSLRLRGGATFTPDAALSQDSVVESTSSDPSKSKTVRLYGYQGAANFDVYDRHSFSDAVARLMGPAQTVIFAIYKIAPRLESNGKHFSANMPKVYLAGKSYEYWDIRKLFSADGAEKKYAMFVCGLDEQPPRSQWQPFDCDPTYAEAVVYCSRSAESSSNYGAIHDGDEAYLRLPLNAEQLSPNQYFEWMIVVARILTPGAGLHALDFGEAGVLPRCTFGLHRECGDNEPVLFNPKTPGGAGFSPRAWDTLVSDVMEAWFRKKVARAKFDVVPTAYDEFGNKCFVNLGMPGATFETEAIDATAFLTPPPFDDRYNVRRGAPFRKELSDKVHQCLSDALTPEEHSQLDCVNIWANGRFWTGKPIVVELGNFGSELKGFNDRWVVHGIHAYMHVIPSAFFIRPVFKSYKAIVGSGDGNDGVSFSFGGQVTLQEFRSLLTEANVPGLDPSTDHFQIRQTADSHSMYPELNPEMTEAQQKQANRPSFFISPYTDEDEWILVRSQIVSPTVWIDHADASCAVLPTLIDPSPFGFCGTYGNTLHAKERFILDQQHGIPRVVAAQGLVYGNGDVDEGPELVVEEIEDDDADGADLAAARHTEHVLEEILHHATEIENEAANSTPGDAATSNGDRTSSMVLLPLTFEDDAPTQSEADLDGEGLGDFPDMYSIPLRVTMPCPYSYSGCDIVFGSDEPDGQCSVGDLISHCEEHFALEERGADSSSALSRSRTACATCNIVFGAQATDSEKLQHLVDVHNLVYTVEDERIAEVAEVPEVVEEAVKEAVEEAVEEAVQDEVVQEVAIETPLGQHEEPGAMEVYEEGQYTQSGLASPPDSASKPKSQNKRKRRNTPARQTDPSYRPGSDAEDSGVESSGSHSSSMTPSKRAGRAPKRRRMAEKDPAYRPQEDDHNPEDEELPSDVVPDSLESPVVRKKSTKTSPNKRKREADPSYHPSTDVGFIIRVVDGVLDGDSSDGNAGPKPKKKKTALDDPSFRPSEPKTQLYVDDQDEELRRSAVPEWEQGPTDPAGKRKRVIREKGTGLPTAVPKPTAAKPAKPPKPARVSRAATPARSRTSTPARSRAATPARSRAATPARAKAALLPSSSDSLLSQETSSEGRRRSSRSRQPPQKLGQ